MGQAKNRKAEIEALKIQALCNPKTVIGFDIFLRDVEGIDPAVLGEVIVKVGEHFAHPDGFGFVGKPIISVKQPNNPEHPSPNIHSGTFAVTYKWQVGVELNVVEGLQRLRYIFSDTDFGYDGAEFYGQLTKEQRDDLNFSRRE